jgi:altronate dehydratase
VVAYLVECARHVAGEIVAQFEPGGAEANADANADPDVAIAHDTAPGVRLIGFPGCYLNSCAEEIIGRIATHPDVGAVLLVSLGCESMNRYYLADVVRASGRPVEILTIQERGGTSNSIHAGVQWVQHACETLRAQPAAPMHVEPALTLEDSSSLDKLGYALSSLTSAVASRTRAKPEMRGYQEIAVSGPSFEPIGPACLPVSAYDAMRPRTPLGLMAA